MYDSQNIQSALSRIENKKVRENFKREGFYRAQVVSNVDPMGIGRVKVRIPSLHGISSEQTGYIDDTALPFAFPGVIQGAGYSEGQYLLPSVGHTVWVSFEAGTDNLIYFGGLYSQAPENDKYIYKGRATNNGEPIQVITNDLPSDYHPDKHVIYKSYYGDIIYIDDRKKEGSIVIESKSGNQIRFSDQTITMITKEPVNAYLPYMDIMYSSSIYMEGLVCSVNKVDIFTDTDFNMKATSFTRGNIIVFIHNGKIKGHGIIDEISSDSVLVKLISQN